MAFQAASRHPRRYQAPPTPLRPFLISTMLGISIRSSKREPRCRTEVAKRRAREAGRHPIEGTPHHGANKALETTPEFCSSREHRQCLASRHFGNVGSCSDKFGLLITSRRSTASLVSDADKLIDIRFTENDLARSELQIGPEKWAGGKPDR